tara:strand:- start:161 stop:337 length:177 start_codon:yes stop_codon:yes gene_type:complete
MKILLILAAVAASAYLERGNTDDQTAQYCSMTAIYKATHGKAGWPPYLGVACEVANHE